MIKKERGKTNTPTVGVRGTPNSKTTTIQHSSPAGRPKNREITHKTEQENQAKRHLLSARSKNTPFWRFKGEIGEAWSYTWRVEHGYAISFFSDIFIHPAVLALNY